MNAQDFTKPNEIAREEQTSLDKARPALLSDSTRPEDGGRMTISPPAKVKIPHEDFSVLASGIDSLVLVLNASWGELPTFFLRLEDLKARAKEKGEEQPGVINTLDGTMEWSFLVPPYGTKGYEWILNGREFTLKIGGWTEPKSMPSVIVEIRSETLWFLGAKESVNWVIDLLLAQGAKNITAKPSRADLCVDLLVPESLWTQDLIDKKVTRAAFAAVYFDKKNMTGIGIGKGKFSARLYDKPLEIKQQSKKIWMYDEWGLTKVPEGKKIIRVEFQLRREALSELGLNSVDDLFPHCVNAWKYCTEKWLKFQSNPGKHHTQRKTYFWWEKVQSGFANAQGANPLIRCKTNRYRKEQCMDQVLGSLSSIVAMQRIHEEKDDKASSVTDALIDLIKYQRHLETKGKFFSKIVEKKIAKNAGLSKKQSKAFLERLQNGFPSGN